MGRLARGAVPGQSGISYPCPGKPTGKQRDAWAAVMACWMQSLCEKSKHVRAHWQGDPITCHPAQLGTDRPYCRPWRPQGLAPHQLQLVPIPDTPRLSGQAWCLSELQAPACPDATGNLAVKCHAGRTPNRKSCGVLPYPDPVETLEERALRLARQHRLPGELRLELLQQTPCSVCGSTPATLYPHGWRCRDHGRPQPTPGPTTRPTPPAAPPRRYGPVTGTAVEWGRRNHPKRDPAEWPELHRTARLLERAR